MKILSKNLYVRKSNIEGKGLFSKHAYTKGAHVTFIKGTLRKFDPRKNMKSASIPTWYGVSRTLWIDPGDNEFSCFNHSCDPNTAIVGTKKVVARRAIQADEEITFDYSMTDADLHWKLDHLCKCGSKNCRKVIKSIQHLRPRVIENHLPLIPRYFLKIYKKSHPDVKL